MFLVFEVSFRCRCNSEYSFCWFYSIYFPISRRTCASCDGIIKVWLDRCIQKNTIKIPRSHETRWTLLDNIKLYISPESIYVSREIFMYSQIFAFYEWVARSVIPTTLCVRFDPAPIPRPCPAFSFSLLSGFVVDRMCPDNHNWLVVEDGFFPLNGRERIYRERNTVAI